MEVHLIQGLTCSTQLPVGAAERHTRTGGHLGSEGGYYCVQMGHFGKIKLSPVLTGSRAQNYAVARKYILIIRTGP